MSGIAPVTRDHADRRPGWINRLEQFARSAPPVASKEIGHNPGLVAPSSVPNHLKVRVAEGSPLSAGSRRNPNGRVQPRPHARSLLHPWLPQATVADNFAAKRMHLRNGHGLGEPENAFPYGDLELVNHSQVYIVAYLPRDFQP